MNAGTNAGTDAGTDAGTTAPEERAADSGTASVVGHPLVREVVVVLVWFVVLGLVGAVLWWQLTPLAEFTRSGSGAQMDEEQLSRQVATDGWFFVIAAAGGLLSGIALLAWRRRDPIAMVVLVAVGGLLAAWVMVRIGLWLGPPDPKTVLPHVADGAEVPIQLKPHAPGVWFIWPLAALLGAVGVIWGIDDEEKQLLDAPVSGPDKE